MMLHNHTRFGNKMFGGSEDIVWANNHYILNFHCDLDLEHSNPIFPQDTLAYDAVLPNQVWLQTDQHLAVTLILKIVNQFFCMTHRFMIIHHYTKFGIKKNG